MTEAPEDLAQSVSSLAVHFTIFCENSDPILALTAAGSKGSASAPMRRMPATPRRLSGANDSAEVPW